jgi:WD40 repeat protein
VVAGAKDKLVFWDRRTQRNVAIFEEMHAQDVTQVHFHPACPNMLVSGSEDGLVAVFDTASGLGEPRMPHAAAAALLRWSILQVAILPSSKQLTLSADEDEGFLAAVNIETAVSKVGFYGTNLERLWVTSGTETLHLWEWAAACSDGVEGGNGLLAEALSAREELTVTAMAVPGSDLAAGVDYLIGCDYVPATNELWLTAGNNSGAAGVFAVREPAGGVAASGPCSIIGHMSAMLAGGHEDTVRSVIWPSGCGRSPCLSGAEDSRVCMWHATQASSGEARSTSTSSSEGAVRRQVQHAKRTAPY